MKNQKGFSILEIFISLVVGIFLLGGVLATFTSMKSTSQQTSTYGLLQENGRIAINLLSNDLMRQGFWGELSGNLAFSSLLNVPAQEAGDCVGDGLNNSSFPQNIGHFRTLWGETASSSNLLNCITNAKSGSDVIQIKRVISSSLVEADVANNRYYLITNMNSGEIFAGDASPIPTIDYGNIWEYQHHIYYVREDTINGVSVPILMQGRLINTDTVIDFNPILDGIEMIRFSYGVDTDNDGAVNAFISADEMPESYWDNEFDVRILAVKVYVLVRDLYPDFQYENKNIYTLGDTSVSFINDAGDGDNYHRLLLTSTVTLYNARIDSW